MMFKIYPLTDEVLINTYLSACNIERKSNSFVYVMCDIETNSLMGLSQFDIYDGYSYIFNITEAPDLKDFEAMFILTKQTMNFIEKCGVTDCRASLQSADESLLLSAGFENKGKYYHANLTGMFDGNCAGHKKS